MYINATGYYVPSERITNDFFLNINGKTDEWIRQRTGIVTRSRAGGISMTNGKDVFIKACMTMPRNVRGLLERNGLTLDDMSYLVAHQANLRILNNVASDMKLRPEQVL